MNQRSPCSQLPHTHTRHPPIRVRRGGTGSVHCTAATSPLPRHRWPTTPPSPLQKSSVARRPSALPRRGGAKRRRHAPLRSNNARSSPMPLTFRFQMEDSVGEEERREQGKTMPQAKAHQEEAVAAGGVGGGEPAEEGGFLSAMASKIGATMSGTNGSGGDVNATVASGGEEGKRDGNGEPVEEGGFLSSVASKIGAAMSNANAGSEDDGGGNAVSASDREGEEEEDGSGGGGIFYKLLSSSPPASSPASVAAEAEEVKGEEKGHDAAGEQTGILSSMASKIGMVMSAANGNGSHSIEDDNHGGSGDSAETSNGNAVHLGKGEENGGGILSAMASKISMAVSGPNGNGNHSTEDDTKKGTGGAVHGSKGEEEKGHDANGGRIVEQIISNLPSDDQAPDADEASLLIAIIED